MKKRNSLVTKKRDAYKTNWTDWNVDQNKNKINEAIMHCEKPMQFIFYNTKNIWVTLQYVILWQLKVLSQWPESKILYNQRWNCNGVNLKIYIRIFFWWQFDERSIIVRKYLRFLNKQMSTVFFFTIFLHYDIKIVDVIHYEIFQYFVNSEAFEDLQF